MYDLIILDLGGDNAAQFVDCLDQSEFSSTVTQFDRAGFDRISFISPAVIIVDIPNPRMRAKSTINRLRDVSAAPIIFVSSSESVASCILSLEAGADDYLRKPFNKEELLAKTRVLLRQNFGPNSSSRKILRHNDILMDTIKMEVWVGLSRIRFTDLEFNILRYFALNSIRDEI